MPSKTQTGTNGTGGLTDSNRPTKNLYGLFRNARFVGRHYYNLGITLKIMVKPKGNKVATEAYVWRVVNNSEGRLEKRIDVLDKKLDRRFDKVMKYLVDISGKFKKFGEEQTVLSE